MRHALQIGPRQVVLVLCTPALVALAYSEGGISPLQAADVIIPLSLPAG